MKSEIFLALSLIFLVVIAAPAQEQNPPDRTVAVTFDDLPATRLSSGKCNEEVLRKFTEKLVGEISTAGIPATGFVNRGNICADLGDPVLAELLAIWLDAGLELGNHTSDHSGLSRVSIETFQADIIAGEQPLKKVLQSHGRELIWFRYPYLHTGDTPEKKKAIEAFLKKRGYRNAPVTLDNSEWVFAAGYTDAVAANDTELMQKIQDEYINHMQQIFAHFEELSVDLLGYEPPQVLLLHVNELNADTLPRLLEMIRNRGYRFISLSSALEDPAYNRPDEYVGSNGISWLHRWARTEGREILWEPDPADWVMDFLNQDNDY